jgi:hypothetical protein
VSVQHPAVPPPQALGPQAAATYPAIAIATAKINNFFDLKL